MRKRRFHVPMLLALTALALGWGVGLSHAQAGPDAQVQAPGQSPQEGTDPQPATLEKQQALQMQLNRVNNTDRKAAAARAAAARAEAASAALKASDSATPDAAAPPAEGAPR